MAYRVKACGCFDLVMVDYFALVSDCCSNKWSGGMTGIEIFFCFSVIVQIIALVTWYLVGEKYLQNDNAKVFLKKLTNNKGGKL